MNTIRMGVITICAAIGASSYLSLRGAATDAAQPAQVSRAQTVDSAASPQPVSESAEHALHTRTLNTGREPAFEPETADLLQPSWRLDELLDAVTADIDSAGEQVDREALAAMLRSDPELVRTLDY